MKIAVVCGLLASVLLVTVLGPTGSAAAEKQVAVIWEGKSGMTKRVQMGFMHRMRAIGPEVKIINRVELPSMQDAEKAFRELEPTVDGIVFLRSSGAKFLGKANPKVPSFVGGCNNPVDLGAVKQLDAPDGNVTGVTYFIPYEKRFEVLKKMFPTAKSVGIVLQKGHPATPIDQKGTKEQCDRLGLTYQEVVAENANQLLQGAEALADKVQVLIISATGLVIDNTVNLVGIQNRKKVPLFSYAEGRAKLGALAELAARDEELGSMLADSVVDVVVKGKRVAQVPVKMDPKPSLVINDGIAKMLNVSVPAELQGQVQLVQ
ncbi:MAG: ABC transporter substrate binding protein [Thermodesulfobacteriota bacterium]